MARRARTEHESGGAPARWFCLPPAWLEDLERCARDHRIEEGHISRLRDSLVQSAALRKLAESPDPGPHHAWLCFLALVDVILDPEGNGLPLPGIHPPRLQVPWTAKLDPFFSMPGPQGFVRSGTPPGDAQANVVRRLQAAARRLRATAERRRPELVTLERQWRSRWPGGTYTSAEIATLQGERWAIILRAAEPRILSEAAELIERRLAEMGPRVWTPDAGDVREGAPSLIAMLDFALGTDATLGKPAREALIAELVSDFFGARTKEQVRARLADARRLAEKAQGRATRAGHRAWGAHPTYTLRRLVETGRLPAENQRDLVAAPNGKGLRFVIEEPATAERG